MKIHCFLVSVLTLFFAGSLVPSQAEEVRRLSIEDYRDKMKAGWIGQIAGVCWGAPTEFHYQEQIMPEDKMPQWRPEMINDAFGQDDLYVEMTFLRTLEEYGIDVSIRQAGIDFANSQYGLAHANMVGRRNLRTGIAPPDSGHPQFSKCADDIDYQIEADYSGLIAPGMPNVAIQLGDIFGRLMNYGDGVYAGQFVGGMYAEAFFEKDIKKIILAGLGCIPQDSQYAEMVRDVMQWHEENPSDWEKTWWKIEEKYQKNKNYRQFSCEPGKFNIDAKINGAYILMGMLYGRGDLDRTIIISTRCGQDSDCNPSNAAGVLFTSIGSGKLPARFIEKLDHEKHFAFTAYNFPKLLDVCEKLARQYVVREGGRIEKDANGKEFFVIPVRKAKPGPYQPSWNPDPIAQSRFTDEERAKIQHEYLKLRDAVPKRFPGWAISQCGPDMAPDIKDQFRGRQRVLMTHPLEQGVGCLLTSEIKVPTGKTTVLKTVISHHPNADWDLIVHIDGKEIKKQAVSKDTAGSDGWLTVEVDLTPYAGKTVKVQLENAPSGWFCEAGYWSEIEVVHK